MKNFIAIFILILTSCQSEKDYLKEFSDLHTTDSFYTDIGINRENKPTIFTRFKNGYKKALQLPDL